MTETERQDRLIRRGLRLSQLRLLLALADTGQVSAAAAQLAMTQPAASRAMADLEKMTGATLYRRHSRGVTLTETGARLAERARLVLSLLDEAETDVARMTAGTRGEVRIGTVTGPALEILLPVIRELRVTLPEIQVSITVDTSDKLAEGLATRSLDFYIGRLHPSLESRAVAMVPIGAEPVSLITRAGHPLTREPRVTLAECLAYDWVMQPPGGLQRRTMEEYLLSNGFELPARILGTSSTLLTLALIAETNAIAPVARAVAEFFVRREGITPGIAIIAIPEDIQVAPYSLIRRREDPLGAAAERVVRLIEARIRRRGEPG